jgi:hypothetical protein
MKIQIEVLGDLERRLADAARRFGVGAEELTAAALRDLFERSEQEFDRAAAKVLAKNRQTYRSLDRD